MPVQLTTLHLANVKPNSKRRGQGDLWKSQLWKFVILWRQEWSASKLKSVTLLYSKGLEIDEIFHLCQMMTSTPSRLLLRLHQPSLTFQTETRPPANTRWPKVPHRPVSWKYPQVCFLDFYVSPCSFAGFFAPYSCGNFTENLILMLVLFSVSAKSTASSSRSTVAHGGLDGSPAVQKRRSLPPQNSQASASPSNEENQTSMRVRRFICFYDLFIVCT